MNDVIVHGSHNPNIALADVRQNEWRLLQVYLYYRLLLSLSLIAAYFFGNSKQTESISLDEQLYFATSITYFVLAMLSLLTARLNEVMKVLTVIPTIFIPLTFIAGVYGMNFRYMPELAWRWGYPLVMLGMAGIAVALYFYFRRKKWL